MVTLFFVDDCLMFIPSKDKVDGVYASIQVDFKIEDYGDINKYLGIELNRRPDGSIHLSQTYLIQRILNTIPCMDKSSSKLTPAVKPPLEKNEVSQARKNDFNY